MYKSSGQRIINVCVLRNDKKSQNIVKSYKEMQGNIYKSVQSVAIRCILFTSFRYKSGHLNDFTRYIYIFLDKSGNPDGFVLHQALR